MKASDIRAYYAGENGSSSRLMVSYQKSAFLSQLLNWKLVGANCVILPPR